MTVDIFGIEDMESALGNVPKYEEVSYGERCIIIPLGKLARIKIRTSISAGSAASDGAGKDSIRVVLENNAGKLLFKDPQKYISRVHGWQDRLSERIDMVRSVYEQSRYCQVCHNPKVVVKAKAGYYFAKCYNSEHFSQSFCKIDIERPPRYFAFDDDPDIVEQNNPDIAPVILPDETRVPEHAVTRDLTGGSQAFLGQRLQWNERKLAVSLPDGFDFGSLNDHQQAVVRHCARGPVSVEAGPGSGKTTTFKFVITSLVKGGVSPMRILAVTFTASAAMEMRVRLAKMFWPDLADEEIERKFGIQPDETNAIIDAYDDDPLTEFLKEQVCTVHALCYRAIKTRFPRLKVLNGRDKVEIASSLKDILVQYKYDGGLKTVQWYISLAINAFADPRDCYDFFYDAVTMLGGSASSENIEMLVECYKTYVGFCASRNCVDFDMMQARCLSLLRSDSAFLKQMQSRFDVVIVDEGQDLSANQVEILDLIASKHGNIMIIGDGDQSIYAWRGAKAAYTLRVGFETIWGDSAVTRFTMPVNYRSTKGIISLSARLINMAYTEDTRRFMKELQGASGCVDGQEPELDIYPFFKDLTNAVVQRILEDSDFKNWHIISRTRGECARLHTELCKAGIPAINVSGGGLGSEYVDKILAYLRIASDYEGARNDVEILSKVANVASDEFIAPGTRRRHLPDCPTGGRGRGCNCPVIQIGGVDHSHARFYGAKAVEKAGGWDGIIRQSKITYGDGAYFAHGARDFVMFVDRVAKITDALEALNYVVDHSVLPYYAKETGVDISDLSDESFLDDIAMLRDMAEGKSVILFLTEIDALIKAMSGTDKEAVIISTVHWAKGKEAPKVIVNMTRMPIIPPPPGELPTSLPRDPVEELNICYVACTRAREFLWAVTSRKWEGRKIPESPFESAFTKRVEHILPDFDS